MNARKTIQDAIDRLGLTQYRVAAEAGIDRAFFHRVLTAERPLSYELIDKLAPVLKLDPDKLKAQVDADRLGEEGLERLKRYIYVPSEATLRDMAWSDYESLKEALLAGSLDEEGERRFIDTIRMMYPDKKMQDAELKEHDLLEIAARYDAEDRENESALRAADHHGKTPRAEEAIRLLTAMSPDEREATLRELRLRFETHPEHT